MTPTIIRTDKVFDYRDILGPDGRPLRHGIFVHRRRWSPTEGKEFDWTFSSRNETPDQIVANAVVVVARVGDRILVADEVRIPLSPTSETIGREFGFAAGLLEPGESAEVAGVRELREETGLFATRVYTGLSANQPLLISSAGLSDEAVKIVFVDAEGEISHDLCEQGEIIHAELMTVAQIAGLVENPQRLVSAKAWGLMFAWWIAETIAFAPSEDAVVQQEVIWSHKNVPGQESFVLGDRI